MFRRSVRLQDELSDCKRVKAIEGPQFRALRRDRRRPSDAALSYLFIDIYGKIGIDRALPWLVRQP
jgi:hypothetical protein